jgi:putative tricarboxylic transport membrane protein
MDAMKTLRTFLLCIALPAAVPALAGSPSGRPPLAECLVPSKPGGAMDLTCKLAQKAIQGNAGAPGLKLNYLPGGIGAVAWHTVVSQRRAEPETLVAFSGGSLLNLAEGKFGKVGVDDARWVAGLGVDYGVIAVPADSPYRTLRDLVRALRYDPRAVLFGMSGTIGSQDWLKVALLAQRAGVDPHLLRFVALEGGGEEYTAMQAGYVQAVSSDASETAVYARGGKVRVLAVLAERRLPGAMAAVPTAREQGYDVVWPVIRGVWMGPDVSDADYRRWVQAFERAESAPGFALARAQAGLYPFSLTGDALTAYIKRAVADYKRLAREFALMRER